MIESEKPLLLHAEKDGLFGVEKENWMKYFENGDYLRSMEISTEQNYDMIDDRCNNMESEKKEKSVRGKKSLLDRLKEKQQLLNANGRKEYRERKTDGQGNVSYAGEWTSWYTAGYRDILQYAERSVDLAKDSNIRGSIPNFV